MKKIVSLCISIICFFLGTCCFANASMVVLKFDDNTPCESWKTADVIEELIISDLVDFPEIVLVERKENKETIAIESIFNGTDIRHNGILDHNNNEIDAIYDNVVGQVSVHRKGDVISLEKSQYLGKIHQAKYLMHGTIDYLGTSESSFMSPIPKYDFSYKAPCLDAVVTVRIIESQTGRVVWLCQERGSSKESLWKYRGVAIGSGELNSQLFVEALTKIDKKILKQLEDDLKTGSLKL